MNELEYRNFERRLMKLESMIIDIYDASISRKKVCPVCNDEIRLYLPYGEELRPNAQCPVCKSLERHRTLWLYFEKQANLFDRDIKVLHFAPEGIFYNKFSKNAFIDYYPVDINPKFPGIRDAVDITNIPYEADKFDLIICNHVIEHISDEQKALSELYRVMKKSGIAIINAPVFDLCVTLENPEYNTPELRSKYYGQFDHVRKYGKDYIEHLKKGGFNVEVIEPNKQYTEEELMENGLFRNEKIYKCTK